MDIRRVLCPSDLSDSSRQALAQAAELARWWTATLDVLHVVAPQALAVPTTPMAPVPGLGPASAASPIPAPGPSSADLVRSAGEDLRHFVAPAEKTGVRLVTTIREGEAVEVILEHAERVEADVIVMGTRGRSGLERLVLGSAAENVLSRARCPVLTIRAESRAHAVPRRVLCPIDFSDTSMEALRWGLSLAAKARARTRVLHVIGVPPAPAPPAVAGAAEQVDLAHGRAVEALDEALEGLDTGETARARLERAVAHGVPPHQIVQVAEEDDADLIVMGAHGHGAIGRTLFGSTTHHVVREAPCPVLTVRQRST